MAFRRGVQESGGTGRLSHTNIWAGEVGHMSIRYRMHDEDASVSISVSDPVHVSPPRSRHHGDVLLAIEWYA